MKGRDRCDEIIRLIDEILADSTAPVPVPERVRAAGPRASHGGALR